MVAQDLCTSHFTIDSALPRSELIRLIGVVLLLAIKSYLSLVTRWDTPKHSTVFPSYGIRSIDALHLISSIGLTLSLSHTILWFIFYSRSKVSENCLQYACMLQDDEFQSYTTCYFVFFIAVTLFFSALRPLNARRYADHVASFLMWPRLSTSSRDTGKEHIANGANKAVLVIAGAGRGLDAFPIVRQFQKNIAAFKSTGGVTPYISESHNPSESPSSLHVASHPTNTSPSAEIYLLDSYNSKYCKESSDWIFKNASLEGFTIEKHDGGKIAATAPSTPTSHIKLIESTYQNIPLDNQSVDIFSTPLGGPSFFSVPDARGLLSTSRKIEIYFDEVHRVLKDDGVVLSSMSTLFAGDFKEYVENTKKFTVVKCENYNLIWNFIYPTRVLVLKKVCMKKRRQRSRTYEYSMKVLKEDNSKLSSARDDAVPVLLAEESLKDVNWGIFVVTCLLTLLWAIAVATFSSFLLDFQVPSNFPYGYTLAKCLVNNLGSVPIGLYFVWKNSSKEADTFSFENRGAKLISITQIDNLKGRVKKAVSRNIVILIVVCAFFTGIFWFPVFVLDLILLDSSNSKYDTKSIQVYYIT